MQTAVVSNKQEIVGAACIDAVHWGEKWVEHKNVA